VLHVPPGAPTAVMVALVTPAGTCSTRLPVTS